MTEKLFSTGSSRATMLVLPFPPTSNRYYRSITVNGSARVVLSAEGRSYRQSVCSDCWLVQDKFDWPHTGRLRVEVTLRRKDKRTYDIDNYVNTAEVPG